MTHANSIARRKYDNGRFRHGSEPSVSTKSRQRPICEYIESRDDHLEITVWLPGQDLPEGTAGELHLIGKNKTVAASSSTTVDSRVSATGKWTLCRFVFQVPTAELEAGTFTPSFTYGGRREQPQPLAPSAGLLAESRYRQVAEGLFFKSVPTARQTIVRLLVDRGSRADSIKRKLRALLSDVGFIACGRRLSWVRLARFITKPFAPRGDVWILGEREESARDNSTVLFAYLREKNPDAHIYYVIEKKASMRVNVAKWGNVIDHSSLRHRFLFLHAKVLINSYSIKHMIPATWHPGAYMQQAVWRLEAKRVYLKHGVHLSPFAVKRANGGYDMVCAVGSRELRELERTTGYTEQLKLTGLARYDRLFKAREEKKDFILFMPTWRRYLVPKLFSGEQEAVAEYQGSVYEQFVTGLLSHKGLSEFLKRSDLELVVVPHHNMAVHINETHPVAENIRVLPAVNADIPNLLRDCRALITDYSSVHFDAAYAGAPVIYAQFDAEDFAALHGASSWFDFRQDGFGPVVRNVNDVASELERYARANFAREDVYESRVVAAFSFSDDRNCERIVRAIRDLV